MKARKFFYFIADILFISLFLIFIFFPEYATLNTRESLEFCAKNLVPSLFIYMVLSKMIITLPVVDKLTKKFGYETITFITGNLCGCPIGAKNAVSLFETGRITKKHAEFLCSFTNNASISFVIGFVGNELFDDTKIGIRLFIYQLIASAITAFIMKFLIFGKEKIPKSSFSSCKRIGLKEAVADSAATIINVCAAAIFFMVCGSAISEIFGFGSYLNAVLKSVLEFSSGCAAASELENGAFAIAAFSVGFTGLSVALQVKSVISGKLSFFPFFVGKLISCSLMTVLAVIFG